MKKIVHICQSSIGGTVEYLYLLISNLDKNKYENILIAPSSGNLIKKLSSLNIKIYDVDMVREISILKDIRSIIKIRKILKQEKPDIIYLHSSKAGVLGRVANLLYKSKVLYNPHGWSFNMECSKKKKEFYAMVEKQLEPLTYKIINISRDEYESAIKYNLKSSKMVVIENGIDIHKYENNEKIEFKNKFVIGFVGRISEQKNPFFLLEICKLLKEKKEKDFIFYVVGDGELREKFEKLITEYNLKEYFYLVGWSNKVEEHIRNFDVALMVSKWEGFGLVVCEYMASKKPIITVAVGGVKDILNERNSFYLQEYSPIKFVENIKLVKENPILVNKKINIAYNDVVNKFSIEKMINKLERIID